MFKKSFKQIVLSALVLTNLTSPTLVLAQAYDYRTGVRDLRVVGVNGGTSGDGTTVLEAKVEPNPSSQSFGSVIVGQVSEPRTVTFTNTGLLPAQLGTAYASTEYQVSNECNSVVLAASQSCTVQVRFAPGTVKNFAPGTVSVPYSFAGSTGTPTAVANFTAIGAPVPIVYAPVLSLDVSSLNFGSVAIGSTLTRHAVLSNTGNLDATLSASNVPAGLTLSGNCPTVLAAGQSCDIDVVFTPTDTTLKSGVLLLSANGSASYASLSFSAQGVDTYTFDLSSSSVSFASLEQGAKTVILTNTGSAALTNPAISTSGSAFSASHNCQTVAPASQCAISVTRTGSTPELASGTLSVNFENAAARNVSLASTLTGSVLTVLSSAEQSFSNVTTGQTSAPLTYIVSNTGNLDANVLVSTPSQSAVSKSGTCGGTLAVGAQCSVVLQFSPSVHGPVNGVITLQDTLTDRDFTGNALLSYSGQGMGFPVVQATVSGGSVFAPSPVGAPVQKTLTIVNSGTFEATDLSVALSGAAEFSLTSSCAATFAAGDSCTATLTFTPSAIATVNAVVAINASNTSAYNVNVQGSGQAAILAADVSTQSFGTVAIGSSATQTTTITNNGNIAAALSYSAVSAPFSRSGTCSTTLAAGASCTVALTYAPTDTSTSNGSLVVSAAGTSASVSFSGTGLANPAFSVSASSVSFGNVASNSSGTQSVVVQNTGNVALNSPVITVTGANVSAAHDCPSVLPLGASCIVTLTFTPTGVQAASGSLSITYSGLTVQTLTVSGTGQAVMLSVDSPIQDFGTVAIGQTATLSTTLTNNGNVSAALTYSTLGAQFSRGGTCSGTLAANASCTLLLSFTPNTTDFSFETLSIEAPGSTASIGVAGTGVALPSFSVSSTSVAFGNVAANATTTSTVQVNNTGNVALSTPAINTTGAGFSAAHNCPATMAVGASCQATVTFAPTAPQSYSGSLSVNWAGLTAQTATLSGTGQAAVLAADVATQSFGTVAIGSSSIKTTTITNNGNIAAALNYSAVSAPFSRSGTCSTTLAAGSSCTVVLTYAPTDTSTSNGSVTVSATGTSTTVSFSGTGQANPSFSLGGSSVAFGNLAVNATTTSAVQVSNTGNVALTTPAISTSGTGFSVSHNCPATLAVGATCQATVTFAPTAAQSYSGSLSVSWAGLTARTATLSGAGTAVTFSVDYLVVGGGGGGGSTNINTNGGGGGAVKTGTVNSTTFVNGNSYAITVGAGGTPTGTGGTTTFAGVNSANGGSPADVSTSGSGNSAGSANTWAGAGGGGACGPGGSASGYKGTAGTGGAGCQWALNGTYYGGGGGGAQYSGGGGAAYVAPSGAGSYGSGYYSNGCSAGPANSGGGASGVAGNYYSTWGCAGGSGIVIVSYPGGTAKATGGTITVSGGRVWHTFTTSGAFTPSTF